MFRQVRIASDQGDQKEWEGEAKAQERAHIRHDLKRKNALLDVVCVVQDDQVSSGFFGLNLLERETGVKPPKHSDNQT